jgi:lipid II:glycine glycyltransferase (peptidoglycan interpeptide bridge formation enzyme)
LISLDVVDAARWSKIAKTFSDYSCEQAYAFAALAAKRTGSELLPVVVKQDGTDIGAACVRLKRIPVLNRGIAYILAGPMVRNDHQSGETDRLRIVLEALVARFRDEEGHLLRIRLPVLHATNPAALEIFRTLGFEETRGNKTYRTVLLDLSLAEETLRANLHSKWRNQLNRAEKLDIRLVSGRGSDLIRRFIAIYQQMKKFKSFSSGVDPEFLLELEDTDFMYDAVIASHNGKDVAGHVVCHTPFCATYVLGATNEEGRALQAGSYLNWQAVLSAKSRGNLWFDLGGIDKEENPDGYQFKIRMGGEERTAMGPFDARAPGFGGIVVQACESLYRLQQAILKRSYRNMGRRPVETVMSFVSQEG